jgi:hypothetical protein
MAVSRDLPERRLRFIEIGRRALKPVQAGSGIQYHCRQWLPYLTINRGPNCAPGHRPRLALTASILCHGDLVMVWVERPGIERGLGRRSSCRRQLRISTECAEVRSSKHIASPVASPSAGPRKLSMPIDRAARKELVKGRFAVHHRSAAREGAAATLLSCCPRALEIRGDLDLGDTCIILHCGRAFAVGRGRLHSARVDFAASLSFRS